MKDRMKKVHWHTVIFNIGHKAALGILIVWLCRALAWGQEASAAEKAYQRGLVAAEQQAWDLAIANFTEAQKASPHEPRYLYSLGLAHASAGHDLAGAAWLSAYLAAAPDAANAAAVRGTVYWLTRDGRQIPVTSGSTLYTGSRIITGADGRLQILLLDETVFTIGANSDKVLDEFVYDPALNVHKITTQLAHGIFRWVTGKVGGKSPGQFRVILPVVAIGIRGTDFEVQYEPNAPGFIRLFSGELEIAETQNGKSFTMHAGQTAAISSKGSLSLPE